MKQTSTVQAGPRRLILINSGKFDYAEIDLTQPFQLVGVNGLGKTALISTLQYLYVDNQRDMRFGQHTTDESRRFYFKGETSLIIYECDTPLGVQSIGVRSDGPASGHELKRYAWRGDFLRGDFIDEKHSPLPWSEVQKRLEPKGLTLLAETVDLRRLLGAVDEKTKGSWNLVPLADAKDYQRFRQTFQRLLQLRDIRQEDLKQLLADCAKLGPSQREVNLVEEHSRQLQIISRDRHEVELLKQAQKLVIEVRELFDRESAARAVAHAVAGELRERHRNYAMAYQQEIAALRTTKDQADDELKRLNEQKDGLMQTLTEAAGLEGEINGLLRRLAEMRKLFAGFAFELEIQARDNLSEEIRGIDVRIRNAPKEKADVIRQQLADKRLLLQQRKATVKRVNDFFIAWLRKRMPAGEAERLAALFHRGVLESFVNEQVQIKDEKKMLERLQAAARRCDARGYEDEAVILDFPAGAIRQAAQVGNATALEQEIRSIEREVANLETDLDTLTRLDELRARRPLAQQAYDAQAKRVIEYETFQKQVFEEEGWRVQLNESRDRQTQVKAELETNELGRVKATGRSEGAVAKFDKLQQERAKVAVEAQNFPFPPGDDPGSTPLGKAAVSELPEALTEVFVKAREKCQTAVGCAESLKNRIDLLDRDFGTASFMYDRSAPVETRLRRLETEIASLPDRMQTIEKRWRGVLVDARAGFQSMLKSLESVGKVVRKLNKELGKIEFSSIASVTLDVVEQEKAVTEYRRQAADAMEPSLFETPTDAENKIRQFTQMLQQRPKLALNDLFALRCYVQRHDGQKNTYDDFDSVESTGTTIVLKVTLNLLVLRDLLVPGKARIPFYLDEVHALDRQNFCNILQLSERLGFVGIYAAPTNASGPRRYIHLVPDNKGHLVVTLAHQKDITRLPGEAAAKEATNN